jgi:hypothetical protein
LCAICRALDGAAGIPNQTIEQGMSNVEAIGQRKKLHHPTFFVRYSFREHGKFIILELPTSEELSYFSAV